MPNSISPPLITRERWLLGGLLVSLFFSVYLMFPVAGGAHPLPFAAGLASLKMVRDAVVGIGIGVLLILAWRRAAGADDPSTQGRLKSLLDQAGLTVLPFLIYFALLVVIQFAVAAAAGDRTQLVAVAMGLRNTVLFGVFAIAVALTVRPVVVGRLVEIIGVAFTVVAAIGLLETQWNVIHNPIWDTTVGDIVTRRISSTLADHIRCGTVCALGVTLWTARLVTLDRRRWRPMLWAGAGFVMCAAALAATGARAPAAAALAGVLVVIVRRRRWCWLAVLPVLLVLILAAAPGLRARVAATVGGWRDWGQAALQADIGDLREDLEPDHSPDWEPDIAEDRTVSSTRRRLSTARLALLELREDGHWVFGLGLGRSALALKYAFGARVMPLESAALNITYEAGLVGLVCTLLLVLGRPRRGQESGAARASPDAPRPPLLDMLVVLGLMSVTYETTAGFPINLLFGAVIGLRRSLARGD
ncbi:MAG: hypothetical protein QNL91_01820 [Candidatus Krumholzibacteria bacterium]|nr:hypothetical protein [Candidatus Krumholzibacteria bacterium]